MFMLKKGVYQMIFYTLTLFIVVRKIFGENGSEKTECGLNARRDWSRFSNPVYCLWQMAKP